MRSHNDILAYQKQYRKDNPDKIRRWRQSNPERVMLHKAKVRAKEENVPFDLEPEDIVIPEVCPVLGIKLEQGVGVMQDSSPSLDKIIPRLGYVKRNVRVISYRANRIKCDASEEEIQKVLNYIQGDK